jgi:adsorption protein B
VSAPESWLANCLVWLALWVLVSGLDDLFVDAVCLLEGLRRRLGRPERQTPPVGEESGGAGPKWIAVLIPLWREHRVIGQMLERNLSACRYPHYEVFAGCYPNDEATVAAVREAAARHPKVHVALCPHGGPTSKADCLNWAYRRMAEYEKERGLRFAAVVIHDAEDWMHPDELGWINYYLQRYEMVQIPVLPLPTGPGQFTHGVYCDEFAEYQSKDVPARLRLGAALPSNGVGTGFSREALERLAARQGGRLFDPEALTEDYAIGLRLHRLGCKQYFVPIAFCGGGPVATREYFPQNFRAAVRQRTRWVRGIALQGWGQFGWSGTAAEKYFLWRDRKGLLGNPLSVLINALFLYGLLDWAACRWSGRAWGWAQAVGTAWPLQLTLLMQFWRMAVRAYCAGRIYGWRFALASPLRIFWANWINFAATAAALGGYLADRRRKAAPAWLKTEHRYPTRAAVAGSRPLLGELLEGSGLISRAELAEALANKPARVRLGEFLIRTGRLTETQVYAALSRQQDVPLERFQPGDIPRPVARALPAALVRRWKVLPFKVAHGNLFVAGPELLSEAAEEELRRYTPLEIRFHLLTPSNFEQLRRELIEPGPRARAG